MELQIVRLALLLDQAMKQHNIYFMHATESNRYGTSLNVFS